MRNLLSLALFTGVTAAIAAAGCTTNNNTQAAPSANAVVPAAGFAGRQLRVQISGDNTNWTSSATVAMGDGITVGTVTVASPTDLFADITIMPDAAVGMRDVTVTAGSEKDTLMQAFEITSAVSSTSAGDFAQGSIGQVIITNHDFDTPFDLTTDANGAFVNLSVTAGTGVTLTVTAATEYSITATATLDIDAAAGAFPRRGVAHLEARTVVGTVLVACRARQAAIGYGEGKHQLLCLLDATARLLLLAPRGLRGEGVHQAAHEQGDDHQRDRELRKREAGAVRPCTQGSRPAEINRL